MIMTILGWAFFILIILAGIGKYQEDKELREKKKKENQEFDENLKLMSEQMDRNIQRAEDDLKTEQIIIGRHPSENDDGKVPEISAKSVGPVEEVENTADNDAEYYTHMEPAAFCFVDNYTVIDIETEGFNFRQDKIVELSAIRVRDNKIVDQFQVFNKDSKVTDFLLDNSPLTQTVIDEQGIEIKEMLKQFLGFLGDDDMVGHNIGFDLNFIRYNLHYYELGDLRNYYVDTMLIGKYFAQPNWHHHKVDNYISRYPAKVGGDNLQQHTAINDVMIEKRIYDLQRETLGEDWTGTADASMLWSLPKHRIQLTEDGLQEVKLNRMKDKANRLQNEKKYAEAGDAFTELFYEKKGDVFSDKEIKQIYKGAINNYEKAKDPESMIMAIQQYENAFEYFMTQADHNWVNRRKEKLGIE